MRAVQRDSSANFLSIPGSIPFAGCRTGRCDRCGERKQGKKRSVWEIVANRRKEERERASLPSSSSSSSSLGLRSNVGVAKNDHEERGDGSWPNYLPFQAHGNSHWTRNYINCLRLDEIACFKVVHLSFFLFRLEREGSDDFLYFYSVRSDWLLEFYLLEAWSRQITARKTAREETIEV